MNSKLMLFGLLALAVVILAGLPSFAAIVGSAHDFTSASWSGNEICAPCHVPHNASSEAALWARSLPDSSNFTLWGSGDILGKRSLTCLSCHDGTVAIGIHGEKMGDIAPFADLGEDLTNDHPVGVDYPIAGRSSFNPAVESSRGTSAKVQGATPTLNVYKSEDGEFRVECSSCHNVHGSGIPGADMLRMSNYGSALCLECHIR